MYADIKAIYDREQSTIFNMAISHLVDIGWRNAVEITDEEIDKMEGNGLMTQEFVQYLVKLSREIAQTVSPTELIKFCQVEKPYDTKGYKTKRRSA